MAQAGTRRNTARSGNSQPTSPISTAMATFPVRSRAALRPKRRAIRSDGNRPSVSVAIAGLSMPPTAASTQEAASTGQKYGKSATRSVASESATRAPSRITRLSRTASMAVPMGVCTTMPTMPDTVLTSPTEASFQPRCT